MSYRVAVLVSGSGTLLQALIDAYAQPSSPVDLVVVGSEMPGCAALERAASAQIPTFTHPMEPFAPRGTAARRSWDSELADLVSSHHVDLVVLAGFMKLFDQPFLERFEGRILNSHPSLLPAFPGQHAPRDALAYGVKISGATLFTVDAGVDTGTILAQSAVEVLETDTVETLHERIKVAERAMLVTTVADLARRSGRPVDPPEPHEG